MSPMQNIC